MNKIFNFTQTKNVFLLIICPVLEYLLPIFKTIPFTFAKNFNWFPCFKIAKLHGEKCDAEESLEDILAEVKTIAEKVRYNHPLRSCVDVIVGKCPEVFRTTLRRNVEDYRDFDESRSSDSDVPSEKYLVALHNRLIKSLQVSSRCVNQWEAMMAEAFMGEDVVRNEANTNRQFVLSSLTRQGVIFQWLKSPRLEWIYRCVARKWMLKFGALVLAMLTVAVIWSEMTFFNKKPVLSLFALFLNASRQTYNYVSIEVSEVQVLLNVI